MVTIFNITTIVVVILLHKTDAMTLINFIHIYKSTTTLIVTMTIDVHIHVDMAVVAGRYHRTAALLYGHDLRSTELQWGQRRRMR